MPKPFLILQLRPEDETADNEFVAIKRYGGLVDSEVRRLRVERSSVREIDITDYAAIIVGGSPFDISTPTASKSTLQLRIEEDFRDLLDVVVENDFPFLGCCSGNGLLGSYLGAPISTRYAEPVGGTDIELTEAGKSDPLLAGFPKSFRVLLGHKEACDTTPEGAVLLASNSACPVQMFRVKRNIYATQFHPEADAEGFIVRINIYKDFGYFPAASAEKLKAAVENEETPQAQLILRRFVDTYRE